MKHSFLFAYLLFFSVYAFAQPKYALGTWIDYLPYKSAQFVTQSNDKIYCASNVSLYSVDKSDFSMEKISKCTGLSDIGCNALAYDNVRDQLIIAYQNSNMDIYSSGSVINLPQIEMQNIAGDKNIYDIYISGNVAYLSCGFGIEVLGLDTLNFLDTYYIGSVGNALKVNQVTSDSIYLYAATDSGLLRANINSFLSSFSSWQKLGPANGLPQTSCQHVISSNNKVYAVFDSALYSKNDSTWSVILKKPGSYTFNSIYINGSSLYSCLLSSTGQAEVNVLNTTTLQDSSIGNSYFLGDPEQVVVDQKGTLWLADLYYGLSYGNGKVQYPIFPDGPGSNDVWQVDAYNGNIYVAPGGLNDDLNGTYNRDGFFIYQNGSWHNFNQYNTPLLNADSMVFDFISVAHNPFNGNTYFTSFDDGGAVEADRNFSMKMYKQDYFLFNPGWSADYQVYSTAVDDSGNVWFSNPTTDRPLVVKKSDGTWLSFPVQQVSNTNLIQQIYPDIYNQVWMTLKGDGLLVFNYGSSLNSNSTASYVALNTGVGTGNLPDPNVNAMVLDNNGEMWLGTDAGIAVIYCPSSLFQPGGCDAQQIIVVGSDSIAGYLLSTEVVTSIDIDAGDRKWVGTDDGLFLLSEDGTNQVYNFTTANSPLFSNTITSLKVDNSTGLVYIGTDKGLMAYQSDATLPSTAAKCNMLVYPNPVAHDYSGPIAFRNLPYNCTVKISDVEGRLVYQTTSSGGTATWDGMNYQGERAHTGIYYVTAEAINSNTSQESSCVSTLIFVK